MAAETESNEKEINLPEICKAYTYIYKKGNERLVVIEGNSEKYKDYKEEWVEAKNLTKNHFLAISKLNETEKKDSVNIYEFLDKEKCILEGGFVYLKNGRKDQRKYIPNEVNLNDFLKLVGYYLSEGYLREGVFFAFNKKERECVDEIKKLFLDLFNINKMREYTRGNVTEIGVESFILRDLFSMFGRGAKNKTIPFWIFKLDKSKCETLIKYYWRGDGCYNKDRGILFSTSSKNLAYQLRVLLAKCDILSNLQYSKNNRGSINGRKLNGSILFDICCGNKKSRSINLVGLENYKGTLSREVNTIHETDEFFFIPIKKIEEVELNEKAYNLEVEDDESYVVEHVAVHNCTFQRYNEIIEQVIIEDKMYRDFP